jgi:hypothetical protein
MKRPTSSQFVAALNSTSDRYMRGLISRQTFDTHMRALWGAVEQTRAMSSRVRAALRRQTLTQLQGGAR